MDEVSEPEERGVPAWVMTFADLMTLLMCFFVLLLAFSEMDVAKFKQLSGSMREAFGVQAEIKAKTIPKGTSIIAQEFSPGTPNPTPMNQVRQFTIDSNRNTLDALQRRQRHEEETKDHAKRIREALRNEIDSGNVAVRTEGVKVIIHILEKTSFESGMAELRPEFLPILAKIADLIDTNDGLVSVSGHTDNVPIANSRFRSNWELSTSRAVSVAHELLARSDVQEGRLMVAGHAATRPRADNLTSDNRAKNRRVDISIIRGTELDEDRELSIDASLSGTDQTEDSPT